MIDKLPPRADETDDCPPHSWKITTDNDGNLVHRCCKCLAEKVVRKQSGGVHYQKAKKGKGKQNEQDV